jgi:hypothetical protein
VKLPVVPEARTVAALAFAVVVVLASCGRSDAAAAPAKKVPAEIVPAQLPSAPGDPLLTLEEYKQGAERIDAAGGRSMVADGRVWEVRRGSTLVGALQVSTLQPKVDVSSRKQREKLAGLVMSGSIQRIVVSGVEVVAARTADKVVFLWFGDQLFEVLQIKGAGINPETMLKSILEFQKPTGQLRIKTGGSK